MFSLVFLVFFMVSTSKNAWCWRANKIMYGSIAEIYIFYTLCHDFEMNIFGRFKKRIYLDYAAATPLHPVVKKTMQPFLVETFGNPSAIHKEGVRARQAVEVARQHVATTLGIRPDGIIFTSSGTESNNLALLGLIKKLSRKDGIPYGEMEVVSTRIEHPSIINVLSVLEASGVTVRYVEVNSEGKITLPALAAALSPKTVLLTFAYANSEVGVVQNVARLVREVRRYEKEQGTKIYIHLDAAQAPLWLPCAMERLGVDLLSLDAGKCQGPKGVGVLALRGAVELLPIMYGGGQERGIRPGTENVAAIVGAATALSLAQRDYNERAKKVSIVRDTFVAELKKAWPEAVLNGPADEDRLANNINISLPGFDTEYAVVYLDTHGIAVSTKSACAGAGGGESVVVATMTGDTRRATSTLRLSLSPDTTETDMKKVIEVLLRFREIMQTLT
jgi:cysteine desulfurase